MRKKIGAKKPIRLPATVSNVRKFKSLSAMKMAQLKVENLKKRTFSKMQWSLRAYNDWRLQRMAKDDVDVRIIDADLSNLGGLKKQNLCFTLCHFIAEVTKVRDVKDYPGKTLYEMLMSIQKFLHLNRLMSKILDKPEFVDLKVVLDNIMKERAERNIGITVRQAAYIPYDVVKDL